MTLKYTFSPTSSPVVEGERRLVQDRDVVVRP